MIEVTTKSISPDQAIHERAAGFVLYAPLDRPCGERRFLVLCHRAGGHWAFPKGRIESGESEYEAALRELREETGIGRVCPLEGFRAESRYRFRREGQWIDKTVVYFAAESKEGSVRLSDEHTAWAWLGRSEAAQRLTYAEARNVLARVDRMAEEERSR